MKFIISVLVTALVFCGYMTFKEAEKFTSPAEYFTAAVNTVIDIETSGWGLDSLDSNNVDQLTDLTYNSEHSGAGVTVYVLDTGVAPIDEIGAITASYNFTGEDSPMGECFDHGTSMSSIISGDTYGVAEKANIVDLKVLTCDESISDSTYIYDALQWILDNHDRNTPAVVNMSLSIEGEAPGLELYVNQLAEINIPVIVAAGNQSMDACNNSPASFEQAVTVGGYSYVGETIGLSEVSNYGACVDILAPSQMVESSNNAGAPIYSSGTSDATAYVSGTVALYFQENPKASVAEVENWLYSNALHYKVKADTADRILHLPAGF